MAAKLNMDPYEFFLKNIELTKLPQVYREEFAIAADLMGWKEKWHPRGQNISNGIARGIGLSIHTWGGRGHASDCDLSIHPDGSVDIKMGSQDIGTGTRTVIAIVLARRAQAATAPSRGFRWFAAAVPPPTSRSTM